MFDIKITYPKQISAKERERKAKKTLIICFTVAAVICGIVNLFDNRPPWSLVVVGGMILFWISFVYTPVIADTAISKISTIAVAVCLYLLLIDAVFGRWLSWSENTVTTISFSLLILDGIIFFTAFKKQKHNLLPLAVLILVALTLLTVSFFSKLKTSWQVIVGACVATAIVILAFACYPKQIVEEIKKKFHA